MTNTSPNLTHTATLQSSDFDGTILEIKQGLFCKPCK